MTSALLTRTPPLGPNVHCCVLLISLRMECLTTTRAVSFELTVTAHTTSTQTLSVMINMSNDEKQAKEQSKITYFACVHHPAGTVLPRLVSLYHDPLQLRVLFNNSNDCLLTRGGRFGAIKQGTFYTHNR